MKPKDASVDKIPPVQMELKFVDLTGPVTIPAESAETIIKVSTEPGAPRPVGQVEITQTLDTRQFLINGALLLEVKATATGLVPDLDQLLDLAPLKKVTAIRNIDGHEGLQIKELNTWGDRVAPRSERLWTLALDGDPIREAEGLTEVPFPQPKIKEAVAVYQTYSDMNLTTLSQPSTKIGRTTTGGGVAADSGSHWWVSVLAVIGIGAAGYFLFFVPRPGTNDQRSVKARELFKMPSEVDGFAVVALLRKLRSSPDVQLPETQRAELQEDLQRVQEACFGGNGDAMSESSLRDVAEKWLRLAS